MAEVSKLRAVLTLCKNLVLAALLYAAIYGVITFINDPSVAAKGKIGIPAFLDKAGRTITWVPAPMSIPRPTLIC